MSMVAATFALSGMDLSALPIREGAGESNGAEVRYPIPAADGVTVDMKAQVILVRFRSTIYAFALSCPHEQAAVKWDPKEGRFQCTKHKSRYTPDGTYTSGRATRNMDRFPVRRDGDAVLVTTTSVFRSDQNPTGWTGAALAL